MRFPLSIKYGQIRDTHLGNNGQDAVYSRLHEFGRRVRMGGRAGIGADKWDILVDDRWHVEVKTARPREINGSVGWYFNIHRHGVLDESKVDLYILRLEKVPYSKYAIHLLLPSPLKQFTLAVTFRKLLNGFAKYAEAFQQFCKTGQNPFLEGRYPRPESQQVEA